jgi:hypothetical protein
VDVEVSLTFVPAVVVVSLIIGRFCPATRPDLAIEIARANRVPLGLAANAAPTDEGYILDEIARGCCSTCESEVADAVWTRGH